MLWHALFHAPARYASLAAPLGIVGAIAIEASPLTSENDWLLETVRASDFLVGFIGDLVPTAADFPASLDRLHREPLFLGFRHGNLWDRSLASDLESPALWSALQQLDDAQLVLESANPDVILLRALLRVAERRPRLRLVIDHVPHMEEPPSPGARQELDHLLQALAQAPSVALKFSEIPRVQAGRPVLDLSVYQDRLEMLWHRFGPGRLIFGSD